MARALTGKYYLNLDLLASAHWEGDRLYLRFSTGTFETLYGESADRVWRVLQGSAHRLDAPTEDQKAASET